ncbi:MAG: hypothetical protein OXI53_03845 [Nitrospira sp.]|nr:hypothetical protein [Nitrospira sp.]MDE0404420.1 hypothetical protein [Nitrospira sp.]MDE0487467.1 hypothetical protein [Nitrospira sp.]
MMEPYEEKKQVAHTDRSTDSASQDNPNEEVKKMAVNQGDAGAMISQPTTNPPLLLSTSKVPLSKALHREGWIPPYYLTLQIKALD